MAYKIVDTDTTKVDAQKLIVEEISVLERTDPFTLADLQAALAKWQETKTQAEANIAKLTVKITEVQALFKK